jgi:hypothetical protein
MLCITVDHRITHNSVGRQYMNGSICFMKVMVIYGNKLMFLILENTKQKHEVASTHSLYQNGQFLNAETINFNYS